MVKTKHKKKSTHKTSKTHSDKYKHQLNPKKVGLALGYTAVIYILILTICTAISNRGIAIVNLLSSLYVGYRISFWGAIVGMAWAFVDWFIGGFIFALIYNKVQEYK